MRQLTIAIEEDTLEAYQKYARRHGMSVDEAIQRVLARGVSRENEGWLEECFELMDRTGADSRGQRWKREDLYDG